MEAEFTTGPEILYPNLSVEANIILQTRKEVLSIPLSYLLDGRYVLVSPNDRQEVETGIRDLKRVEILSGIDSATVIYKP